MIGVERGPQIDRMSPDNDDPLRDSRQLQSQSSDHMGAVGRRQDGVRPVQGAFEAAWSNASNAGAQKSPAAVP
jgi:hypothetical protein